jgi:hypothetical protein
MGGDMLEFLQFYYEVLWWVPQLLWHSIVTVDGAISAALFVAAYFVSSEIVKRHSEWNVSKRKLAAWAVGLYFVFLLLQSNYAAFKQLKSDNASAIKTIEDKLDKATRDKDTLTLINDQLTKSNAALQVGAPVLTDAQLRIEAIREQLLEHADEAPTKEQFTLEQALEWWRVASAMKEQTISDDSTLYLMFIDEHKGTYDDLLTAVGTLRAIAVNVTEKDLRANTRNSQ